MLLLPNVYAYRDIEVKSELSRWKPRRVLCTRQPDHVDRPGDIYVVKYRQGRVGTAATISEVVTHALFETMGFRTLQATLVWVNAGLSRSYHQDLGILKGLDYEVVGGWHFGTLERNDVTPGPPEHWDQIANPRELIELWVGDCWLMNLDRMEYGNILMTGTENKQWHLIPADQSDCFLGAGSLTDGTYMQRGKQTHTAPTETLLTKAFQEYGCETLYRMLDQVKMASDHIDHAMERVPEEWWSEAGVDSQQVKLCLLDRANRIKTITKVKHWEGIVNATKSGYQFDI